MGGGILAGRDREWEVSMLTPVFLVVQGGRVGLPGLAAAQESSKWQAWPSSTPRPSTAWASALTAKLTPVVPGGIVFHVSHFFRA